MWKSCFKLLCCLAVLVLLGGCSERERDDYVEVNYDMNFESLTNAQGQELHWWIDDMPVPRPEGNMDHTRLGGWDTNVRVSVPYSRSFTIHSREELRNITKEDVSYYVRYFYYFGVEYYKDGECISDIDVCCHYGDFTIFDGNWAEYSGDSTEISIRFIVPEDGKRIGYELEGTSAGYSVFSLESGYISASGMVGEYTVTKYDMDKYNLHEDPLDIKTYQGDGQT